MIMRTFATFEATGFPNESEWTESGSPLVPDGRSVSRTLAAALKAMGHRVTQPTQHSFYGWAFEVACPKQMEWCLLQGGDPWLLVVEERRLGWHRLFGSGRSPDLAAALRAVDQALRNDPRFSCVQWFTKCDYEAGAKEGAETPL